MAARASRDNRSLSVAFTDSGASSSTYRQLMWSLRVFSLPLGAVFDLSGRPRYVHWHFFQMSVVNLVVIVLMIVVFWLAVLLPFPGAKARREGNS